MMLEVGEGLRLSQRESTDMFSRYVNKLRASCPKKPVPFPFICKKMVPMGLEFKLKLELIRFLVDR